VACFLSDAGMKLFGDDLPFQSHEGLIVSLRRLLYACNELWTQENRQS
jgi:hypothetical protein